MSGLLAAASVELGGGELCGCRKHSPVDTSKDWGRWDSKLGHFTGSDCAALHGLGILSKVSIWPVITVYESLSLAGFPPNNRSLRCAVGSASARAEARRSRRNGYIQHAPVKRTVCSTVSYAFWSAHIFPEIHWNHDSFDRCVVESHQLRLAAGVGPLSGGDSGS